MSDTIRSPWLIHYDGSSCNGCDIEVLACLTPLYDVERFGIINTGNPKHADIFVVTGSINEANREVIQNIYNQMPDPKVVVAVGICACSGGVFRECYNVAGGVDTVAEMLNLADRATEKSIMEGLEAEDPDLVEQIRRLEQKVPDFSSGENSLMNCAANPGSNCVPAQAAISPRAQSRLCAFL